jgi:hypothetical protein
VRTPQPAEIVVMAGGGVTLIFSFLAFYSSQYSDESVNAWDSRLFPVATLIAVFAFAAGGLVALRWLGVSIPTSIAGFTWKQLVLVGGFFATVLSVAYLIVDAGGGVDKGVGFWFMLIGSIATLVGAILLMRDPAT